MKMREISFSTAEHAALKCLLGRAVGLHVSHVPRDEWHGVDIASAGMMTTAQEAADRASFRQRLAIIKMRRGDLARK